MSRSGTLAGTTMQDRPADRARAYVGRFAPSPTGALHAGSLVAAMASFLDARAHHGRWLVRIEDVDATRSVPGAATEILSTLALLGMHADGEIVWQSQRNELYAAAFAQLAAQVFVCGCSRREIADSQTGELPGNEVVYPGTCRAGLRAGRQPRTWRVRVPSPAAPQRWITFDDRACGHQQQDLARHAGDFVLRRADGFWAYQLAVVVDDAAQGVTDVVRGMDLLDSTPRQIYLQHLLHYPRPQYLHVDLVRNAAGEKLSKQTGAVALDLGKVAATLATAARSLGLQPTPGLTMDGFWQEAIAQWAIRHAADAGRRR